MTVCTRFTAEASVSVAVEPLTATGLVAARSTALPSTVTVKALAGVGTFASASLKVSFRFFPFTSAPSNVGAVASTVEVVQARLDERFVGPELAHSLSVRSPAGREDETKVKKSAVENVSGFTLAVWTLSAPEVTSFRMTAKKSIKGGGPVVA